MKPVCQIYGLCLEDIPNYRSNTDYDKLMQKYLQDIKDKNIKGYIINAKDTLEATKKVLEKKQKEAGKLLFGDFLRTLQNKRTKSVEITKWFKTNPIFKKTSKKYAKVEELSGSESDSDSESDDTDYNLNI